MIINIIGRGEGFEQGYEAEGEKLLINYFDHRGDVLFEIHPTGHPFHEKLARERENARNYGMPIVDHNDYPFKAVMDEFGTDYFGSSGDWAIAYVLLMDPQVEEIHLWGITMDDKGDHYEKRCATDFWCGVAIGRGVKVVVHGNSRVMTTEDGLTYGLFTPMSRKYIAESAGLG